MAMEEWIMMGTPLPFIIIFCGKIMQMDNPELLLTTGIKK